eukprot:gene9759-4922_t
MRRVAADGRTFMPLNLPAFPTLRTLPPNSSDENPPPFVIAQPAVVMPGALVARRTLFPDSAIECHSLYVSPAFRGRDGRSYAPDA